MDDDALKQCHRKPDSGRRCPVFGSIRGHRGRGSTVREITVWIAGDSTVSDFQDQYYMPRKGWGAVLDAFLRPEAHVRNLAVSGTSSKSFRALPEYAELIGGISSGDYLLLGFGHNDEKRGRATFTSGVGDFRTPGSFAASLYESYIRPAQAKGAGVILVTPIVRRSESGIYENGDIHRTVDGDYAQAVRDLGADLGVAVCDLTRETLQLSLTLDGQGKPATAGRGKLSTLWMHAWPGSRAAGVDNTHTNYFGAMVNARLIADDLLRQGHPLSAYLRDPLPDPLHHPEEMTEKSRNPEYIEKPYRRPAGRGKLWPDYIDADGNHWTASVFGDLNGEPADMRDEFSFGTAPDGAMRIEAGRKENNGKIQVKSDGIAMYAIALPAGDAFHLKAEITLESFFTAGGPAETAGFGMMVRDDFYMDVLNMDLMGDYLCAGTAFLEQCPQGCRTFARKSGAIYLGGGALARAPREKDTFTAELYSTGDGYAARFGGGEPVVAGYDFPLTAVDPEYVYVGFFAARSIAVTVRGITLTVNGKPLRGYEWLRIKKNALARAFFAPAEVCRMAEGRRADVL